MKHSYILINLFAAFIISACVAQTEQITTSKLDSPVMNEPNTTAPSENQISTTGTVRFQEIEGGFWGIVADDGRKFDALNLEPSFQKEGLRVRFEAKPETDRMSTRMWGTMVTLQKIEVVE